MNVDELKSKIAFANKVVKLLIICLLYSSTLFAFGTSKDQAISKLNHKISEMRSAINTSTNLNWLSISEYTLKSFIPMLRNNIKQGEFRLMMNDRLIERQYLLAKKISLTKSFIDSFEALTIPNKTELHLKIEYDKAKVEYQKSLKDVIDIRKINKLSDMVINDILEYERQLKEIEKLLNLIDKRKRELKNRK